MSFTEYKTVEKEILDTLQSRELGWRYMPGGQVTADYRGGDEQEMLLIPVLRERLKRLNPGVLVDDDRANMVITRLRALRDNQEWISWIRGERTMQFGPDENAQTITLIDVDDLGQNDFLATNQVWIQGIERRRPDILLFINGIPVVDIEAKTAARGHVDWAQGAKQCDRYGREIPQLYASNCFCVGVNELRMKYGVPGTLLQYWQQWRDPSPHTQISAFDEMKCTVYGLFDRGNLLDIIANFIVFDVEDGKRVKKVARYQQFRAANKIVGRSLGVKQPSGERRGIVWHTQGSGKSLTMIFAARKLWNHPALQQPTLVIVVDREQLEEQMAGELYGTNTENVAVAGTKRELRNLLARDYRGVILTLVHKFDDIEPEMTSRANVIVLVDEAHRTQYGDLGVFMRTAMPNASMFGFTGTPIELGDRHTPRAFGKEVEPDKFERYMDRYSIEDSIRDGATKPIHYEVRLTDWTVEHADLDTKFEELFADRTEEERRLLMREARLEAILRHPRRIAQVGRVLRLADHEVVGVASLSCRIESGETVGRTAALDLLERRDYGHCGPQRVSREIEVVLVRRLDSVPQNPNQMASERTPLGGGQIRQASLKPVRRPPEEVISLRQPEHGVTERGDADQRSLRPGGITNEVEEVAPRCVLVRDRPEVPGVAPDVLEQRPGRLIADARLNQLQLWLYRCRPPSRQPGRQLSPASEQPIDAAPFHHGDELQRGRLTQLSLACESERAAN